MEIRHAGRSGLRLSSLALGTLMWGRDTDVLEARDMLAAFVTAGGTTLDLSPTHGDGLAVDAVAEALAPIGRHRVDLVVHHGAHLGADGRLVPSAARGDMLASLDDLLARLGTDHVDLWLAGPDANTPLEETLSALDVAWRSGRARYVGLTHRSTWDTATAVARTPFTGLPISAVEEEFSLLTAPFGVDLVARATSEGMGFLAHSPLAGGVLTGKYRHGTPADSRAASPHLRHLVEPLLVDALQPIVAAVVRAAEGLDRTPTDVALTWVRDMPGVTSAVVGPRTLRQLEALLTGGEPLPAQIRQVLAEVAGARRRG